MAIGLTVTPGYVLAPGEAIDNAKLNAGFNPVLSIEDGAIGIPKLNEEDVRSIISNSPSNLTGRQNYFLNGNFDFWQRATSFNANVSGADSMPVADCWRVTRNLANRTIERYPFGLGQTAVPTAPVYALKWIQGGPITDGYLAQRVENVRALAGLEATLSIWVFCSVAGNIGLSLWQHFGSGGTPSVIIPLPIVNKPIEADEWTRVHHTFTVPSISGKTLGTDNTKGDWLEGRFFVPNNTAFELYFAGAQLEAGDAVTAFEQYDTATELAGVQRRYEIVKSQLASAFTNYRPVIFYKVTKRWAATPTTLDIAGDTSVPYATYYTALDGGSAEQAITHAQARVTVGIDAELEL